MDFDIDAVLDQLEKKLNQSDLEENHVNQINEISLPISSPTPPSSKSVDELLLLDLDPYSNTENQFNGQDENKLERFKQDLQELYASSIVIDPRIISPPMLPDIVNQQEEIPSTSLPLAVEQLELEVREEILQHTHEQSSLLNGNQEEILSLSTFNDGEIQSEPTSNNRIEDKNEPDLIPQETSTQTVLHSVDSIVNAATVSDLEDYIAPNPSGIDLEPLQTSSELLFTPCEDDEVEETTEMPITEEIKTEDLIQSSLNPPVELTTSTTPIRDFDLVKNILSEIFDKPDEELLDESLLDEKEVDLVDIEQRETFPTTSVSTNNNEDFRFLDEMLASIDVSDTDIHQLTPAEIDRVDNLLKDIVNSQQTNEITSSTIIRMRIHLILFIRLLQNDNHHLLLLNLLLKLHQKQQKQQQQL
ncbi:hypothetical protein I4U23_027954 [Adineta vaga]|nr:hypothetical protein I4U23_027954 [Adineta vaga]